MKQTSLSFKDLVEAAAKPYRELWKDDGSLNLNALSRHYKSRGARQVSVASLSRLMREDARQTLGEAIIEATSVAFGIPKNALRGEPMTSDVEQSLTQFRYSTLLLAKRLEDLPKEDFYAISDSIQRAENNLSKLREAMKNGNVSQIDRRRDPK